jgi:hypothetical protein
MPVIRPIKTIVRGIRGDKEAARRAFLEATRTAFVLIAGAAGFCLAGPPLAVVCSVGMGVQWDLAVIIPSHGKQIEGICHIIDDPFSLNAWIDGVIGVAGDGITGVCGGHLVKVVGTTTLSSAKI